MFSSVTARWMRTEISARLAARTFLNGGSFLMTKPGSAASFAFWSLANLASRMDRCTPSATAASCDVDDDAKLFDGTDDRWGIKAEQPTAAAAMVADSAARLNMAILITRSD